MPPDEQADVAATRPSPGPEGSPGEPDTYYNPGRVPPKPTSVRDVVRLFQCRICSFPLREPVCLPCGQNLCRQCLPKPHRRVNITYPAGPDRQQGFQCPFVQCGKEHSMDDCVTDVILNKAAVYIKTEIDHGREDASDSEEIVIHIVSQDPWAAAGVASLRGGQDRSRVIKGGKFVATFALAEEGELEYEDDVWYEDSSTAAGRKPIIFNDMGVLKKAQEMIRPEMDCQVCYCIFYDPLTTACGHTFCRSCLHRILDHSRHCPVCRRQLAINPLLNRASCPSNDNMTKIIETFWIDEILARKATMLDDEVRQQAEFDVSLFICTLSFPHMPTFLHIFEPRYRLMIRRATEGNRTFGMVMPRRPRGPSDANFYELGTLLRITNAQFYPDGRSLIETVGLSRFRVTRHGMLDGYTVGKIERIDDVSLEQEEASEAAEAIPELEPAADPHDDDDNDGHEDKPPTPPPSHPMRTREDLETMTTQSLMEYALSFVERMRHQSAAWLAERMISIYGECPQDPAIFPWWFASMLPVKDSEKYRLLSTSSVRDRLKICCAWIIEWESTRWISVDLDPGLSTTAESSEDSD